MSIQKINNFIIRNIFFILIILFVLFFISFQNIKKGNINNDQNTFAKSNKLARLSNSTPTTFAVQNKNSKDSKIMKLFSLSLEVKNVDKTKNEILNKINSYGGILTSFYSYNYYNDELAYNYKFKVPSEEALNLITQFKSLGLVNNESSSAFDSSKQYEDNKNRLINLYIRRNKLRKIMNNKAQKLSDIIAIDRELNNIQNQIENLENINKNINNNVSYSQLELSIAPKLKIKHFNNSTWEIENSWNEAINNFIIFTQKTIDFAFNVLIFVPLIILIFIFSKVFKIIFTKNKKK